MNRHLKLKPYCCSECGKAFYQKDRLKTHIMSHTGDRPFECSICRRSFRRRYELNRHNKIHDDSQRMKMLKYVCEICGKRSYSKADNSKHMLKHSSIRQWECCLCDAAFKEKYTLRNHLLAQHEEPSKENPVYSIYTSYFT
jgi:KRAB domain-containing zinc finger protein